MKKFLPILFFVASSNILCLAKDTSKQFNNIKVPSPKISYRILLGVFSDSIPNKILNSYLDIGGVTPVQNSDGSTSYYSAAFESKKECKAMMKEYLKLYEFKNMSIYIESDGEFYAENEFSN